MIGQMTNHIWQSTVFVLAVGALTCLFRKSGAHVRYWMWFSASVKFFVPFALLIAFGRQLEWAGSVGQSSSPSVSAVMVQISEPFSQTALPDLPSPPTKAPSTGIMWSILAGIWGCGFLVIVFIRVRLWRRIRDAVRASASLELPDMDIPAGMQIRSTVGLFEPGVVGWRHPTLLMPAGLERYLTRSQLKAIVAHEVTHTRRHDNLTAAIHMVTEGLFWFHPLVWWIGARLVDERERACDEEVLRLFREPEAYAEGILTVCKRYVEAPLACVSGVSGSNIKKRMEAIMRNRVGIRLTFGKKIGLALAALFALATPIVVGSMSRPLQAPPPIAARAALQPAAIVESPATVQFSPPAPANPPSTTAAPPAIQAAAERKEFEEASIRPCDPDNLPPTPPGQRGGNVNSFQMTPGRTHVFCMTLATIIRTAYGYSPAQLAFLNPDGRGRGMNFNNLYGLGVEDGVRVRGGPAWVRSERYTIEAIAEGTSDAATMKGPMLQALLERRFQLKAHIETEQVPAFSLTVAKSGLKIKPVESDACARMPPPTPGVPSILRPVSFADVRRGAKPTCGLTVQRNGPNMVVVGGEIQLVGLARALGGQLGGLQVTDKTGVDDKFNFILEFAHDDNSPGLIGFNLLPDNSEGLDVPPGQPIFAALEEQLGLKLEPAQAPREFIVIDHVERPSPN